MVIEVEEEDFLYRCLVVSKEGAFDRKMYSVIINDYLSRPCRRRWPMVTWGYNLASKQWVGTIQRGRPIHCVIESRR